MLQETAVSRLASFFPTFGLHAAAIRASHTNAHRSLSAASARALFNKAGAAALAVPLLHASQPSS